MCCTRTKIASCSTCTPRSHRCCRRHRTDRTDQLIRTPLLLILHFCQLLSSFTAAGFCTDPHARFPKSIQASNQNALLCVVAWSPLRAVPRGPVVLLMPAGALCGGLMTSVWQAICASSRLLIIVPVVATKHRHHRRHHHPLASSTRGVPS